MLELLEQQIAIGDLAIEPTYRKAREGFLQPLLRTMGGRPVLMQRFPHGAGGPSFFQKRVPKNAPEWLQTTIVSTPNGTTSRALVLADMAHVVWAVNLGCLDFNPHPVRRTDRSHPDELRIDLDPQPGTDFRDAARVAREGGEPGLLVAERVGDRHEAHRQRHRAPISRAHTLADALPRRRHRAPRPAS